MSGILNLFILCKFRIMYLWSQDTATTATKTKNNNGATELTDGSSSGQLYTFARKCSRKCVCVYVNLCVCVYVCLLEYWKLKEPTYRSRNNSSCSNKNSTSKDNIKPVKATITNTKHLRIIYMYMYICMSSNKKSQNESVYFGGGLKAAEAGSPWSSRIFCLEGA